MLTSIGNQGREKQKAIEQVSIASQITTFSEHYIAGHNQGIAGTLALLGKLCLIYRHSSR